VTSEILRSRIVLGRKLLKYMLEFVSNEQGICLDMLRVNIEGKFVSYWKVLLISGQTFSLARN